MLTKGERMEFVDVAKELGKELDLYHYFEKLLLASVSDLLCIIRSTSQLSDKIMQIEDLDEKYKQIDDYAQKKAKS